MRWFGASTCCEVTRNWEEVNPLPPPNQAKPVLNWTSASPLLRQYLGSVVDPELIVYRIRPGQVLYRRE